MKMYDCSTELAIYKTYWLWRPTTTQHSAVSHSAQMASRFMRMVSDLSEWIYAPEVSISSGEYCPAVSVHWTVGDLHAWIKFEPQPKFYPYRYSIRKFSFVGDTMVWLSDQRGAAQKGKDYVIPNNLLDYLEILGKLRAGRMALADARYWLHSAGQGGMVSRYNDFRRDNPRKEVVFLSHADE